MQVHRSYCHSKCRESWDTLTVYISWTYCRVAPFWEKATSLGFFFLFFSLSISDTTLLCFSPWFYNVQSTMMMLKTSCLSYCVDIPFVCSQVEAILSKSRYLVGDRLTEADIRLFTTLVRFDTVYHTHFKVRAPLTVMSRECTGNLLLCDPFKL